MASREGFTFRQKNAGDFFRVFLKDDSTIAGYICATLLRDSNYTEEELSKHDPKGTVLALHSVSVAKDFQRKGLATKMLNVYTEEARKWSSANDNQIKKLVLTCKENLICLYEGAGYCKKGKSDMVHGKDPWFKMELDL